MSGLSRTALEQATCIIASFISELTPESRVGTHPILLISGIDVLVELKSGLENKLTVTAKIKDCIVYRTKLDHKTLVEGLPAPEYLYTSILPSVLQALVDHCVIQDHSLMKLISAVGNRSTKHEEIVLPGGFVVSIQPSVITIVDFEGKPVKLLDFDYNGYPLSPALCIPKSIAIHMGKNDYKPLLIN